MNTIRPQTMYVCGILYLELREWRDLLVVDALLLFYYVYQAMQWCWEEDMMDFSHLLFKIKSKREVFLHDLEFDNGSLRCSKSCCALGESNPPHCEAI